MFRPILGHRLTPPWPVKALAATLLLVLGLAAGLNAGQSDPQEKRSHRSGGFDFFATQRGGTHFSFTGEFALPRGFFDAASARFESRVPFKGVPLQTFKGEKVGNADTVIERKSMPNLGPPFPSRGTTEIEMVALSLESVQPVKVKVGRKTELWDVKFQVSPGRPSLGKMTLSQRNERGGTFSTELTVFGSFTFVRRGDGAQRTLDLGSRQLGQTGLKAITLRAADIPWETRLPRGAVAVQGLSDRFSAGTSEGTALIINDQHAKASHKFLLATFPIN